MKFRIKMRAAIFVALCCCVVTAQTPAPSPKKPLPPVRTFKTGEKSPAPQVVTIIHRLNGLKMFRLLARSQQHVQAISSLDFSFSLMDDVHTNIIAGLALDDGETIAAWLPEAEVEFGPVAVPAPPSVPEEPAMPNMPKSFFDAPDITVIGADGRRLPAKYIGFDGVTGLSILRLTKKNPVAAVAFKDAVNTGEAVLLYQPEPVQGARTMLRPKLYARMAAIEGRIQTVLQAPSGGVARFRVSARKLSAGNIGGVALNQAGETIGIVDGLEGSDASILPVTLIKRAAERVLKQQASVPRPWLGVKGEAIASLKFDQIMNHGWAYKAAEDLANQHRGLMLTSIVPGSPAALASLRAGDVILKVDDKDIQTADDFTWWLDQAKPSSVMEFTVMRPDRPVQVELNVKLSQSIEPSFSFNLRTPLTPPKGFSLIDQGIETIALKPPVATQLGTTAGLLVVYVDPVTAAFEAGLQPGDVIQSINGKSITVFKLDPKPATYTFEVVRKKEKLVVTVPAKK